MEVKESTRAFLESTGLVQSYECKIYPDLLTSLCEHGLPTGDLYEFSALMVLKFEKKFKAQHRLNKPKPAQLSSPTNKPLPHEHDQIKHEDKTIKQKEDKKSKNNLEDEKTPKKDPKKSENKNNKAPKPPKEHAENEQNELLGSEDKKLVKQRKN